MFSILSALLFLLFIESAVADGTPVAQPIFELGPYPIPYELDGVKTSFNTWLQFIPVIEGRGVPTYKLLMRVRLQIDSLPQFFVDYARSKTPNDNCARINNIDNWVYSFKTAPFQISDDRHNLTLGSSGDVSTWTCTESLPETVCDHYRDSLGIEWPYNCKTRRGSPIKTQNFIQGFDIKKSLFFSTDGNGNILYKDEKPTVWWTGDSLPTQVLNLLTFVMNNFGAMIGNALMSPKLIEMNVPDDFKVLHPGYEDAYFERNPSGVFIIASASVSVTADQVNDFMRKHFGPIWHDIPKAAQPVNTVMTRKRLEAMCSQYDPHDGVVICGLKMGFDYNHLPE